MHDLWVDIFMLYECSEALVKYEYTGGRHSGYNRSFEATLDNTIPVYTSTGRSYDYYTTHRDSILDSYNYNLL